MLPITVWPDTWSPLFGSATDLVFVDDNGVCYKYQRLVVCDVGGTPSGSGRLLDRSVDILD
jgi:hypothetical protein